MLDVLRHHASSWVIKALLGLIIVTFVISFGTTMLRKSDSLHPDDVVATVEDHEINAQTLRGRVKLARENNPLLKSLPPEFESQLQNMVLGELVSEELAKKQAIKQGLRVTDAELADAIRNDPGLKDKNGNFDSEFYLQRLRPGFFTNYNINYESFMKDRLLIRKLEKLYSDPVFVAAPLVKLSYALDHTKLGFKTITLDASQFAKDFKPDPAVLEKEVKKEIAALTTPEQAPDEKAVTEQVIAQLKIEEGLKQAKDLADKIWPGFRAGLSVAAELEKHNLKESELPPASLSNLARALPGLNPDSLSSLAALTTANPAPEKPLEAGGKIYLLRLTSRETPSWENFEKEKAQQEAKLAQQLADEFYDGWFGEVSEQARVEVSRP